MQKTTHSEMSGFFYAWKKWISKWVNKRISLYGARSARKISSCKVRTKNNHTLAPCGRGKNFLASECELRNLGDGSVGSPNVRNAGGQAYLEDRKLGRYEDRLLTENNLPSYPPISHPPLYFPSPQGRGKRKLTSPLSHRRGVLRT